jgi:hypothetical protein
MGVATRRFSALKTIGEIIVDEVDEDSTGWGGGYTLFLSHTMLLLVDETLALHTLVQRQARVWRPHPLPPIVEAANGEDETRQFSSGDGEDKADDIGG